MLGEFAAQQGARNGENDYKGPRTRGLENGTSEEWLWSSPRASRIRRGSITDNKKPPFFNGGFIGGRYFQLHI
jgi:hypothetical protein